MALRVIILRNSRSEVFCKKGVLRNFGKFTGKHLPEPCNFIQKETLAQVFSVNFLKLLRTPFLTEHRRWLLLHSEKNDWISKRFGVSFDVAIFKNKNQYIYF